MDGEAGFTVGAQANEVLFDNASAVLTVHHHRGDRSTEALSNLLRPRLRARHRLQRAAVLAGAAGGLNDRAEPYDFSTSFTASEVGAQAFPTDRDLAVLLDINRAARQIIDFVDDVPDEPAFLHDLKTQSAVLYQISIIGEAVGRLSDDFKNDHPDVPWRDIRGMRNIILHAYDNVDMPRVWDVVQNDVPDLLDEIAPLLPSP